GLDWGDDFKVGKEILEVRGADAVQVVSHSGLVTRRVVAGAALRGKHPLAGLLHPERAAARPGQPVAAGRGPEVDRGDAGGPALARAEVGGGVPPAGVHGRLHGPGVSDLLEPVGGARRAPARVDYQVGVDDPGGAAVLVLRPDARDRAVDRGE